MTSDTLIGKALDEAVEAALGDDLSCGENRERLADAIRDWYCEEACKGGREFLLAVNPLGHKDAADFPYPYGFELSLWQNRHGQPWQAALESHVAAYRADPRPFHRDLVLAMGLLDEYIAVSMNFSLDAGGVQYVSVMKPGSGSWAGNGEAWLSEFPDAKDDAERRVLATCTAIARAVLKAKEDANG